VNAPSRVYSQESKQQAHYHSSRKNSNKEENIIFQHLSSGKFISGYVPHDLSPRENIIATQLLSWHRRARKAAQFAQS